MWPEMKRCCSLAEDVSQQTCSTLTSKEKHAVPVGVKPGIKRDLILNYLEFNLQPYQHLSISFTWKCIQAKCACPPVKLKLAHELT